MASGASNLSPKLSEQDAVKTADQVQAISAEARAKAREQIETQGTDLPKPQAFEAKTDDAQRIAGELVNSEELAYLNREHVYPVQEIQSENIRSHRKVFGNLIVKLKRRIHNLLSHHIFSSYFQSELKYQANLAAYLNKLSTYVDARDSHVFWELVRKIDHDVNKALTRIDLVKDDQGAELRSTERRLIDSVQPSFEELKGYIRELQQTVAKHEARLGTVESVSTGLERIIARLSAPATNSSATQSSSQANSSQTSSAASAPVDNSYLLLENRFRGSEAEIRERLGFYVDIFRNATRPVLEIGSGRGELQSLFRAAGVDSYGVEMDSGMIEHSKALGLNIISGNGITYLEEIADASIGGVVATQVIEHLQLDNLKKLLQLCLKKVIPGGIIAFETINSDSMVALARHYFRDPTHVWPLHPETMRFLLELSGLEVTEVRQLSPFPQAAQLQPLTLEDYMTPRWAFTVDRLNENFQRLNELLFGAQDYCIIARVPTHGTNSHPRS